MRGVCMQFALAAMAAASGCASWSPEPVEQFASASASVEAARAAGAEQYANKEFVNARLKLETARNFDKSGEHARARQLAIEAGVDAQLARAKAATERSMLAVAEVDAGMRALREALQRGEPQPSIAIPQAVAPRGGPAAPVAPAVQATPVAPAIDPGPAAPAIQVAPPATRPQ